MRQSEQRALHQKAIWDYNKLYRLRRRNRRRNPRPFRKFGRRPMTLPHPGLSLNNLDVVAYMQARQYWWRRGYLRNLNFGPKPEPVHRPLVFVDDVAWSLAHGYALEERYEKLPEMQLKEIRPKPKRGHCMFCREPGHNSRTCESLRFVAAVFDVTLIREGGEDMTA